MLFPLGKALIGMEEPILAEHGVSMWAYAVLVGLGDEPVRTQAALAEAIGADKSRLIPILDDLQDRALIARHPDPADRRVRLVQITEEGKRVRDRVQRAIHAAEDRLLGQLPKADREAFVRSLTALTRAATRRDDAS